MRQPVGHAAGGVEVAHLGQHLVGRQEVRGDEAAQVVADAVLVGRDDGGVRNRQPERVAKQRHHGKPVGHGADHGGFGKGGDVAPCGVARRHRRGQRIQAGRAHQQAQRQPFHAGGVARAPQQRVRHLHAAPPGFCACGQRT